MHRPIENRATLIERVATLYQGISAPDRCSARAVLLVIVVMLLSLNAGGLDVRSGSVVESVRAAGGQVFDLATQAPALSVAGDEDMESLGTNTVAGDLDGDGIDDLILGAPWASRDDEMAAGHVYVFFGGEERPASVNGDGADVTIVGAAAYHQIGGGSDRLPGRIAVGNVNDDPYDDLILGVPDAPGPSDVPDAPGNPRSGRVYVIFGRSREDWQSSSTVDLGALANGVEFTTDQTNVLLGSAVAAGDVNGDGTGDVIAGARLADGEGDSGPRNAGEVYAFFGRGTWPAVMTVEGDADLRVIGAHASEFLGSGLATGQLGGTDADEIVIGARGYDRPEGGGSMVGAAYVLFGSTELGGNWALSETPADWTIRGADHLDRIGHYLAVGDVSGDGEADLVIGVPKGGGPDNERFNAGEVAVLLGPRTSGTATDLADGADMMIYGPQAADAKSGGHLGDNVVLGDLNDDGVMDIVVGSPYGDAAGDGLEAAGEVYVIFGGNLPGAYDLRAQDANITVYGEADGDHLSRVAAGNLDDAPPDDLALGAYQAEVPDGNPMEQAGKAYVLFREEESATPTPTVTTTVTPSPTASPGPTVTPTAFEYLPLVVKSHSD